MNILGIDYVVGEDGLYRVSEWECASENNEFVEKVKKMYETLAEMCICLGCVRTETTQEVCSI